MTVAESHELLSEDIRGVRSEIGTVAADVLAIKLDMAKRSGIWMVVSKLGLFAAGVGATVLGSLII